MGFEYLKKNDDVNKVYDMLWCENRDVGTLFQFAHLIAGDCRPLFDGYDHSQVVASLMEEISGTGRFKGPKKGPNAKKRNVAASGNRQKPKRRRLSEHREIDCRAEKRAAD